MTRKDCAEALRVVRGLLRIAKLAMPDTYYMSDSRVKRAQAFVQHLKTRELQ